MPNLPTKVSWIQGVLLVLVLSAVFGYLFSNSSQLVLLPEIHKNLQRLNYNSLFSNNSEPENDECRPLHELIRQPVNPKLEITDKTVIERNGIVNSSTCPEIMKNSKRKSPMMKKDDIEVFRRYLKQKKESQKCMSYVEWGSGGSTFVSLQYAARILTIENHKEWCDIITKDPLIQVLISDLLISYALFRFTAFIYRGGNILIDTIGVYQLLSRCLVS